MARLPRLCPAGVPLHVMQRGNNKQACFACHEDYISYLGFLQQAADAYGVDIHAWVLMTNHVHLLATSRHDNSISKMVQYIGRCYVRYFNMKYSRTGTLWEGRYKSCVVDSDSYFLSCQRYIELNPVRAGMAKDPSEYRWSSFRKNALEREDKLVTPGEAYKALGQCDASRATAYRNLFTHEIDVQLVSELREATSKGLAFGQGRFKEQIEALYGRRVRPRRPGPKCQ